MTSSAVITAFNAELFISECLESISGQSVPFDEVIIVNDGSTDRTEEVVSEFRDRIAGLIYVYQQNKGPAAGRNVGLKRSTCDLVSFIDADDSWDNRFNELMRNAFCEVKDLTIAHCNSRTVIGDKIILGYPHTETFGLRNDPFEFWQSYMSIYTGTMMFKREIALSIGGQNENLRISQDLEFWVLLLNKSKFYYVDRVLWVGNSYNNSKKIGVYKKYRKRREMAPLIDDWFTRINRSASLAQNSYVIEISEYVAYNLLYSYLMSFQINQALYIVRQNRYNLAKNKLTLLLRRFPFRVIFVLVSLSLIFREKLK